MKNWIIKHKLPILIFFTALAARLILFSVNFAHNDMSLVSTIHGDDGYYELSQGILHGNGFTWDTVAPFKPNPLRPPVWPYLIAFFAGVFQSYWAVFIFEIILGSFIPVLAFFIARRLWGDCIGKWTGIALCFEPYLVLFSFILYTETSFIFFFLISLIFLLRYIEKQSLRSAVWFGVFLSSAILIKPTVQYLPIIIPFVLAYIWRKKLGREHLKQCAAFFAVCILFILPWLYRNHVEFGVWGMSAQPAFNLYVYLAPTVLAIDNGTNFNTEYQKFVKKGNFDELSITLANADFYTDEALKVIKEHKLALVKSGLITLVTFFTHDGMLTILGYSGISIPNILTAPALSLLAHPVELFSVIGHYAASPALLIIIMRLFWIITTLFFLLGCVQYVRRKGLRPEIVIILGIILYFAATTAINGFGVNARFRMPVEVFILGFALYGLFSLKRDNTSNETLDSHTGL